MRHFDVTVVGELNLDLILYGLPAHLEPERELMADGLALTLGSSSAIFAHNLATLGSSVGFVSRIGSDSLGEIALAHLAEGGVDISKVKRAETSAGTGLTVILPRAGSRSILTYAGTMREMCYEDLDLEYLAGARHFHLSSFFLHPTLRPRIPDLFRVMKERGLSTSLDTNDDPEDLWADDLFEVLKFVDVFLPNEREAMKITRRDDLEGAAAELKRRVPVLVVKLGANGAIGIGPQGYVRCPARMVEAIDPVGAGDSFDAGFIHAFLRGADLAGCLEFGNAAGAFSTTRPGGTEAFRDRAYVQEYFKNG